MANQSLERRRATIEWAESITSAIAVILLIFIFVIQPANVDGASMLPTLKSGDKILLRSAFYKPQHGDIVVIDSYNAHGKTLVKRIIAVGGDSVYIDENGNVLVNGTQLEEGYVLTPTYAGNMPNPTTVPQGKVFVMGDNRAGSLDSRNDAVGLVDERDIMGKVLFRLMPQTGRIS